MEIILFLLQQTTLLIDGQILDLVIIIQRHTMYLKPKIYFVRAQLDKTKVNKVKRNVLFLTT